MALTKTQLKEILSAVGVSAENAETAIGKIMDGHLASVNALREREDELKKDVDKYKADALKLADVQKELDGLKAKGDPDWQKKYEKEHEDFETYKTQVANDNAKSEKIKLYRELLRECNVEEKRIDAVLKVTDIEKITVKDGKLENVSDLKDGIKKEWAGFIVKRESRGADVDNPPDRIDGQRMTREEIYKKDEHGRFILDASQRQKALSRLIAEEQQKG